MDYHHHARHTVHGREALAKRVSPLCCSQKRELNPNEQVRSLGTPFASVEMTIPGWAGRERHSGRFAPLENTGILRCAQNDDVKQTATMQR